MERDESPSRRSVLASAVTALSSMVTGCSGVLGEVDGERPVSILSAGSLSLALQEGLDPQTEVPLRIEAHGSVAAARMAAKGQRDPDIVALADPALFRSVLDATWLAEFASNAIVVAVNTASEGGRAVLDADEWFRPIVDGDTTLGRTDPDLDPLGYRTLFMLRLASRYYGRENLAAAVLGAGQIFPETALLSHFESGSVDVAIVYRNMAVERGYEFVELPDQVDLGEPVHAADWYSAVSYRLPNGGTISGKPISYGAVIRPGSDGGRVRRVFDRLVSGRFLLDFGFTVPSTYPEYTGDVPDELA